MTPLLRGRLQVLELRQRRLYKRYILYGPSDMDCATALRLLKCKPRPGDEVEYEASYKPGEQPRIMGRYDKISDAEWETLKDYPRCTV